MSNRQARMAGGLVRSCASAVSARSEVDIEDETHFPEGAILTELHKLVCNEEEVRKPRWRAKRALRGDLGSHQKPRHFG